MSPGSKKLLAELVHDVKQIKARDEREKACKFAEVLTHIVTDAIPQLNQAPLRIGMSSETQAQMFDLGLIAIPIHVRRSWKQSSTKSMSKLCTALLRQIKSCHTGRRLCRISTILSKTTSRLLCTTGMIPKQLELANQVFSQFFFKFVLLKSLFLLLRLSGIRKGFSREYLLPFCCGRAQRRARQTCHIHE